MDVNEVETRVRGIINDVVPPYRWSSEKLREYLSTAVRRLNVLNPATRYVDGVLMDEITVPGVNADESEFPVANRYGEALAYYVAHLCYLLDDPDTANAELANTYLAKAERLMT